MSFGAKLGDSLEQHGQPLHRYVRRGRGDEMPRASLDLWKRPESVGVDAHIYEPHPVTLDAEIGVEVLDGRLAHHDRAR